MIAKKTGLMSSLLLLVAACGGGNGDGSSAAVGMTETIPGTAIAANYVLDPGTDEIVLSNVAGPGEPLSLDVTTADGEILAITLTGPLGTVTVDTRNGDIIDIEDDGLVVVEKQDGSTFGFFDDSLNFMTFGSWATGIDTPSSSLLAGVVGFETTTAGLPSGTTATYVGVSTGFARRADGLGYSVLSQIAVDTDFSDATVTSGNSIAFGGASPDVGVSAPELDFTASGPVSGTGFTATVTSPDQTGTAIGQFYGPNAEEVGGTFLVNGTGTEHIGSFGAFR